MRTEKQKQAYRHNRLMEGFITHNPVFVGGMALPFAIMLSYNLKNSVWMSLVMGIVLIPTVLMAYLVGPYLPRWVLVIVCSVFAMGITLAVVPMLRPFAPEVFEALGAYLYLIALNSFLGTLCCRHGLRKHRALYVLTDAVSYSVGFGLAMCILGSVREILGNGTIWGKALNFPIKMTSMQMAFSGFLLIGMFGALVNCIYRYIRAKHYRQDNPKTTVGEGRST